MNLIIRPIKKTDLSDLEILYNKSILENKDGFIQRLDLRQNIKEFILEHQLKGGEFWGLFLNGKIIGMGGIINEGNNICQLCKLHLNSAHKGKKYGEKLARALEDEAKKRGFLKIILHVTKTQAAAIGLYQKLGFKIDKEALDRVIIAGELLTFPTFYMHKIISI